jgi:uncharacterized membrane protein YoaK (UPF0700 family)
MARRIAIPFLLCLVGGYADAASFVLAGSFTGHVTGNAVLLFVGLASHDIHRIVTCAAALAAFLLGTALGIRTPGADDGEHFRRLVPVLLGGFLLIVAGLGSVLLGLDRRLFLFCVSLSLGMQNGALSKAGPVAVHSTYITGMSTSLVGALLGNRRDPKARLLPVVIGGFLAGAASGAALTARFGVAGFGGIVLPLVAALGVALRSP